MPAPTDRGYVVVKDNADGTKTVWICAEVAENYAAKAYARHENVEKLETDASINLRRTGPISRSKQMVEVTHGDDGVVRINQVATL
jgi:hypothetical protein